MCYNDIWIFFKVSAPSGMSILHFYVRLTWDLIKTGSSRLNIFWGASFAQSSVWLHVVLEILVRSAIPRPSGYLFPVVCRPMDSRSFESRSWRRGWSCPVQRCLLLCSVQSFDNKISDNRICWLHDKLLRFIQTWLFLCFMIVTVTYLKSDSVLLLELDAWQRKSICMDEPSEKIKVKI